MTTTALSKGLKQVLEIAEEMILKVDRALEWTEEERQRLVKEREHWCRNRDVIRREVESSNGGHG